MIISPRAQRAILAHREDREMRKDGFARIEADWRLHRGALQDWRVVDVRIAQNGKDLWVKVAPPPEAAQ